MLRIMDHLERNLRRLDLHRRNTYSTDEEVFKFLQRQLRNSAQLRGYKLMHFRCRRAGLKVTQLTVRRILHTLDPERNRKMSGTRRLCAFDLYKGPNYVWRVDSCDKLKPYGIWINGSMDGFSRRIMWMKASSTFNNRRVIAGNYLQAMKTMVGCPQTLHCNGSTVNCYLEDIYFSLNARDDIEPNGTPYLSYIECEALQANQRLEKWWSIHRKHNSEFWVNLFRKLKEDGTFSGSFLDQSLIQYCFMDLIQKDLDEVINEWNNSHRIREMRYCDNYLFTLDKHELESCEEECLFPDKPCDEDVYNFCEFYLTEEMRIQKPDDPFDAVELYLHLRSTVLELI